LMAKHAAAVMATLGSLGSMCFICSVHAGARGFTRTRFEVGGGMPQPKQKPSNALVVPDISFAPQRPGWPAIRNSVYIKRSPGRGGAEAQLRRPCMQRTALGTVCMHAAS